MYQDKASPRGEISVSVVGAGVAGSWHALLFARAGFAVTLYERDTTAMTLATSHWAGGMLAPHCEAEDSEPVIPRLGVRSLDLWREALPETPFNGSLVVSHPRDRNDFDRFARLAPEHRRLGAEDIAQLEPSLDGRFREGLFFPTEGHVEPRRVLPQLHRQITASGATIRFESEREPHDLARDTGGIVIDCRGLAARDAFPDLRPVRGEMVIVETDEVKLSRPVRLIHPRWPLYIIPRDDNRFMIGATSIESGDRGVSVRSALELLSAAYAVHSAFGEARILEIGAGLRPALPDNLPRIAIDDKRISVNGLYRHGFLLAPALAELTLNYVRRGEIDNEVMQCS
ncbi:glycine oxidase [Afipia sp. Root123D2]|uniref:FAD-dependent oxidoreductase n=1 Tax=Afipia sp. Root123D2 TaxID=1736436 RepID=UPI0006F41034|nr:FAD-dependent oxidoreductase [Afipia sp. Root123D2]KQW20828.1 glycine oxidase [Afipia sp. Root123D2]